MDPVLIGGAVAFGLGALVIGLLVRYVRKQGASGALTKVAEDAAKRRRKGEDILAARRDKPHDQWLRDQRRKR